jgi:hypothetical protein
VRRRRFQGIEYARIVTTAELIAKLQSDDPHGVHEVIVWDGDGEVAKGIERVALREDHVVVRVSDKALPVLHREFRPAA